MIKLYFHPSPNPMKIALFLEETGLPYEVIPVDTRKGEQHSPEFLKINPNGKTPALVDGDVVVFDSNAIMLHLAETSGQFMTANDPVTRGQMLSWLMFIATGIGPYSGQSVHFQHFAPEPKEYAVNRYVFEAERHYHVLNDHLANREWLVGDSYSFLDMSLWGWARMVPRVINAEAWAKFPHVKRHLDAINARPAAVRAVEWTTRYTFKAEVDAEARRILFPGNARIGAA
jgi:GST-like protein